MFVHTLTHTHTHTHTLTHADTHTDTHTHTHTQWAGLQVFVQRDKASKDGGGGGISFSGLLNALDGAAASEGCVVLMTTNHKERLDEALIRPGRCDVHVKIQKASQLQAQRMFNRFFAQVGRQLWLRGSYGFEVVMAPRQLWLRGSYGSEAVMAPR